MPPKRRGGTGAGGAARVQAGRKGCGGAGVPRPGCGGVFGGAGRSRYSLQVPPQSSTGLMPEKLSSTAVITTLAAAFINSVTCARVMASTPARFSLPPPPAFKAALKMSIKRASIPSPMFCAMASMPAVMASVNSNDCAVLLFLLFMVMLPAYEPRGRRVRGYACAGYSAGSGEGSTIRNGSSLMQAAGVSWKYAAASPLVTAWR